MMSLWIKKSLGLAVSGLCVFGLIACSGDSSDEMDSADSSAAAPTPAAPAAVFERAPVPPSPTAQEDLLGRGEYLVTTIVGCGNCHHGRDENGEFVDGLEFAGNFVIHEPNGPGPGGRAFSAYAPNITQHAEKGIGAWTDEEIERAIREGISRDGHVLGPPMAFPYYREISSDDMDAIIAYLRTIPAVDRDVEPSTYYIPLPPNWGPPVEEPIANVPRGNTVQYGRYLAHSLGHCTQCHTPLIGGVEDFSQTNAGGNIFPQPFGYDWAALTPNITPHPTDGIGQWSDDEIKRAIVYGISRDGRELLPFMGFSFYEGISDQDLDAIITYLRSVPAMPDYVPEPE
jgi:mono/diheme cytochrome c family protein